MRSQEGVTQGGQSSDQGKETVTLGTGGSDMVTWGALNLPRHLGVVEGTDILILDGKPTS